MLEEGIEHADWVYEGEGDLEKEVKKVRRKGMDPEKARKEGERLRVEKRVAAAKRLSWRVRYFSDGAVIGSREFVDSVFESCRDRFGPKRKSGARRMRGDAAALSRSAGLFSLRAADRPACWAPGGS